MRVRGQSNNSQDDAHSMLAQNDWESFYSDPELPNYLGEVELELLNGF